MRSNNSTAKFARYSYEFVLTVIDKTDFDFIVLTLASKMLIDSLKIRCQTLNKNRPCVNSIIQCKLKKIDFSLEASLFTVMIQKCLFTLKDIS